MVPCRLISLHPAKVALTTDVNTIARNIFITSKPRYHCMKTIASPTHIMLMQELSQLCHDHLPR
jgi:hypothetical protein